MAYIIFYEKYPGGRGQACTDNDLTLNVGGVGSRSGLQESMLLGSALKRINGSTGLRLFQC